MAVDEGQRGSCRVRGEGMLVDEGQLGTQRGMGRKDEQSRDDGILMDKVRQGCSGARD